MSAGAFWLFTLRTEDRMRQFVDSGPAQKSPALKHSWLFGLFEHMRKHWACPTTLACPRNVASEYSTNSSVYDY